MTKYLPTVRQFKCPSCGNELSLISKRTRYVGCKYCGTQIDDSQTSAKIINKLNAYKDNRPQSFIKLGMVAVFDKLRFQVIGRTRWESDYKEWDSEDGAYTSEKWRYDEWLLVSEKFTYIYIIEDAEGFHITRSFLPKYPSVPSGSQITHFYSGKETRFQEFGSSRIKYFEGESTYQVRVDDSVVFGMYKEGSTAYSIESRLDKTGKPVEIEFFWEKYIPRETILSAFIENDEIKKHKGAIAAANKQNTQYMQLFAAFAFLGLLLYFWASYQANEIIKVNTPLLSLKTEQMDTAKVYITETAPFKLTTFAPYRFNLGLENVKDNTDFWIGMEILDDKNKLVNVFEDYFYRASGTEYWSEEGESGYEDWSETETETYTDLRLDEPGTYKLRVKVRPWGTTPIVKDSPTGTETLQLPFNAEQDLAGVNLNIKVDRVHLTRFYFWLSIISGIIAALFGLMWYQNAQKLR